MVYSLAIADGPDAVRKAVDFHGRDTGQPVAADDHRGAEPVEAVDQA